MKGYSVQSGYMGYIPTMGYILFASEGDYAEYYATIHMLMEEGRKENE